MDISVVLGVVIAFGSLILGYTLEHGVLSSLFLISPIVIVFGGTIGAVVLSYSMADSCRQGGILKLQELINDPDLNKDEFLVLKAGMVLALDMKSDKEIQYALESNLYMPFASRLKGVLKRQQILREMMTEGICMIARGESSRSIENKLSVYYQVFPHGDKKYKEGIEK